MDGLQPGKAENSVKLLQHPVQVVCHIIAAVGHVAGVQADSQLVRKLHQVQNGPKLLKAAAHLRALARHGFQQHRGVKLRGEDGVQVVCNQLNAHLGALLYVAARVEVVHGPGNVFQPGKVVRHGLPGEGPQALVGGAGVQGVGSVGQNGEQPLVLGKLVVGGNVLQIQGLCFAAPGIPGEKLEGVGADPHRLPAHGQIALGAGKVAAYFQHTGGFSFLLGAVSRKLSASMF